MLDHRIRCWASIKQTLQQCFVRRWWNVCLMLGCPWKTRKTPEINAPGIDLQEQLVKDNVLPMNMGCSPNVLSMLGHRLQLWPNINPILCGTSYVCWVSLICSTKTHQKLQKNSSLTWHWHVRFSTRPTANTMRWPNTDMMLGQRRRRWANIIPALGQFLALADRLDDALWVIWESLKSQIMVWRGRYGRWWEAKDEWDRSLTLLCGWRTMYGGGDG